jgi:tRNA(His) 5'-end guanylyltransferase
LRIDGCHFHTYTKGLKKPFDNDLSEDIDKSVIALLPQLQGSVFAYAQSDEISILLTDFATPQTSAWFDGNIQKMSSVAASIMTAEFNKLRSQRHIEKLAYFDCRVFTIPDRTEVMNYFRWRQQDCIRNSVSMVAQSIFSHKELHGKSQSDMHEMFYKKGINWATDYTDSQKNGRLIVKETYMTEEGKKHLNKMFDKLIFNEKVDDNNNDNKNIPLNRSRWVSRGAWVFTKDEGALLNRIPEYE